MRLITEPIITWLGHDAYLDTIPLILVVVLLQKDAQIQELDQSLIQPAMMTRSRQARRLPIQVPVPQTYPRPAGGSCWAQWAVFKVERSC
jgi:hypothetical protein